MRCAALSVCVAALLACCALAGATAVSGSVHMFKRSVVPYLWERLDVASGDSVIKVIFALKQQRLHELEALYWQVTDPASPKYAQFLSREEILAIVAPPKSDHDSIAAWIRSFGAEVASYGDALQARVPVSIAQRMFNTTFYNFRRDDGRTIVRHWGSYYLPAAIAEKVQLVAGIGDFPMPANIVTPKTITPMQETVVPQTLRTLYQIPETLMSSNISSQCIGAFVDETAFSSTDLQGYYTATNTVTSPIDQDHIIGPFDASPSDESTLDIQYITSVGREAQNWYWTEQNWMYDFSVSFFNTTVVPSIVSMSYMWSESDQCQWTPECSNLGITSQEYVNRTNIEFQKIGLRGVTLISCSGDSGANSRTDEGCTDPILHPVFPAGSPFVTAVGATQLNNPETSLANPPPVCTSGQFAGTCASGGDEVAVSWNVTNFASGGGFSWYTPRPAFQDDAVAGYMKSGVQFPPTSYFNPNGRGYPDVAALGFNFAINLDGGFTDVSGTSASTPSFAGMVSMLNNIQLQRTGKPLGPLNTLLYTMAAAHPAAFHDITVGDNICTEEGCSSTCQGYVCAKGWDPVTGLGSPNFKEMMNYLFGKEFTAQFYEKQ